jgi:hypothetical protein
MVDGPQTGTRPSPPEDWTTVARSLRPRRTEQGRVAVVGTGTWEPQITPVLLPIGNGLNTHEHMAPRTQLAQSRVLRAAVDPAGVIPSLARASAPRHA